MGLQPMLFGRMERHGPEARATMPPVVAQGSFVRAVRPPETSQPGVLWVIAIGVVLYRFGSRVLRVS